MWWYFTMPMLPQREAAPPSGLGVVAPRRPRGGMERFALPEDLRAFLGRHGGVKSIMLGPRKLRTWGPGAGTSAATFANVWLTDVDAELTSLVQASVEQIATGPRA